MESIDTGRLGAFNNALQWRQQGVNRSLDELSEGLDTSAKNMGGGGGDTAATKGKLEAFIAKNKGSTDPAMIEQVTRATALLGAM